MTFIPHDYQQAAYDEVRRRERSPRPIRLGLQSPTNSGKTVLISKFCQDPMRQLVITNRKILKDQASKVLRAAGVQVGIIASGHKPDPAAPIQIGMAQTITRRISAAINYDVGQQDDGQWAVEFHDDDFTFATEDEAETFAAAHSKERLKRWLDKWPAFDRLHIDEVHGLTGPTFRALFDLCHERGSHIYGYSATMSDVADVVDDVYVVTTKKHLINLGIVKPQITFGCGQPDIRLLEKLRRDDSGEYLAADLDKVVKPEVIFGRVITEYKRLTNGSAFFLNAHSVKSSIWWAQMLSARDIPTAHIDGDDVWVDGKFYKSDSTARAAVFDRCDPNGGNLKGISNRFVLREGVDCPHIGHVILTAPIGTRKTLEQVRGRARAKEFPYSICQDHSGSTLEHPAFDSDEPWDWDQPSGLAEKIRRKGLTEDTIPEPIVCPKCMCERLIGDTCPFCGFRYAKHCRYVIQTNGSLQLIDGKTFRPRKIVRRHGQDMAWERAYWSTVKNGNRTAEQAYAYYAYNNNWNWLPRDLPLMPLRDADWFVPLHSVPMNRLRPQKVTAK